MIDTSNEQCLIHIPLLRAFDELPFLIGKKTFVDLIKGNPNPTIERNSLDELNCYGCLFKYDVSMIFSLLRQLISQNYIEEIITSGFPVIRRTSKGVEELKNPSFKFQKNNENLKDYTLYHSLSPEPITQEDKEVFAQLDFFLHSYNDEQKKAIVSSKKNILCIAGAGTGKTTVLVKRIDFLKKLQSVQEKSILAITFTRKAKEEMKSRLQSLGIYSVEVETFNSFSEKLLKRYEHLVYSQETKVMTFKDKISVVRYAMEQLSVSFESIIEEYFSKKQLREKSKEELFLTFVHDIFSMLDHYKNSQKSITQFYEKETNPKKKRIAKLIYHIIIFSKQELENRGLRDFTDQINHLLEFFKKNINTIPFYNHILVDEFQDLNSMQLELLQILKPSNIFCVGDPRQAIYGWRGSQIQYILDFPKLFSNTQVLSLTKNYRSSSQLISFFNQTITSLNLPNLEVGENAFIDSKELFVVEQDSEMLERIFVVEAIKNSQTPYSEIFVLARTNKLIEQFSDEFSKQKIPFAIKSEEEYKQTPVENAITLATIHSIKGMEATEVYMVGATTNYFPNKVQDNFVVSLIKQDDTYDKEAEELRLFYVGITRAKQKLVITYSGTHTKFLTEEMLQIAEFKPKQKTLFSSKTSLDTEKKDTLTHLLKSWRMEKAKEVDLPAYMIVSNKTLDELVSKIPNSKDELEHISGLGPAKIAKFGDEILSIIHGNI